MTVDFGIDLGTTNSAIGEFEGAGVQIIKNTRGSETTPSMVWIDRGGALHVGHEALQRVEFDPENTASEFKLLLGTDVPKTFARSGRWMSPEELSAEVLKSLKADVLQRKGEDLRAVVITVPAAFRLHQCDATMKAARLAGLEFTPLLMEPVAAAHAYGFGSDDDKALWLVYDLGGGTFDAAVIQMREGEFFVVDHGGDDRLGGKNIDWEIVGKLLIPAVCKEHALSDFRRGNPKWAGAIGKLKYHAEQAKISCSQAMGESAEIDIEHLCQDDRGRPIGFSYTLRREDVARLAEPYVLQSVNICRRTLAARELKTGDIEKILLVGGPTLAPYLRELLDDPVAGLGIPLEFNVDPLTVVARGAAIYAAAQRIEVERIDLKPGQYRIEFDYQPVGIDAEPLVGGRICGSNEGEDLSGYSVEIASRDSNWRSGRIQPATNGVFKVRLRAEKGSRNEFQVTLRDPAGSPCGVEPDCIPFTFGHGETLASLTHSIGVELATGETEFFFTKGTPLPAIRQVVLRTVAEVRKGRSGDVIRIPVVEGEHDRADRNQRIGVLEVKAHEVSRGVPAGSDVEMMIEVDVSRVVSSRAFVPILEDWFDGPIVMGSGPVVDASKLKKEMHGEMSRLKELRQNAVVQGDDRAMQVLDRIEAEQTVDRILTTMAAADGEPQAAIECQMSILDLRATLDEIDEVLEWPGLVEEARQSIAGARALAAVHGEPEDHETLRMYELAIHEAIESCDPRLLALRVSEHMLFCAGYVERTGALQELFFGELAERTGEMEDRLQAELLVSRGGQAIEEGDIDGLRTVNRQLAALLPAPPPSPKESTVTRKI